MNDKKEVSTIVENIKKRGTEFVAIIEPVEIEDEFISEAIISNDIDVKIGDEVIIEKMEGKFVIKEIISKYVTKSNEDYIENETEKQEWLPKPETNEVYSCKESKIKSVFKNVGYWVIGLGGFGTMWIVNILQFFFSAIAGLGSIYSAIILFKKGSILLGLIVLLIVTPLVIWVVNTFFPFWLILSILISVLWGISKIIGLNISFENFFSKGWNILWGLFWIILGLFLLYCVIRLIIIGIRKLMKKS